MTDRRKFIKQTGLLSMAGIIRTNKIAKAEKANNTYVPTSSKWADGSRLVVSATMLLEAGGQPDNACNQVSYWAEKGLVLWLGFMTVF